MSKQKKIKSRKLLVIFLFIFLFAFLPVSPKNLVGLFSHANIDASGNITGYEVWDKDRTINENYIVRPGAVLVIKPGVTITFQWGSIDVRGSMFVNGTLLKPVAIRKGSGWNYYISVEESGRLVVKNANISGLGLGFCTAKNDSILNKALACPVDGGINVYGGWLDVEGSDIHNGDIPFFIENKNLDRIRVNRSKIHDNKDLDVYYAGNSGGDVDFKYNWWGSHDGPTSDKFYINVDFSNYLKQESFHDPVIIVPGILGSAKEDEKWIIDPVWHTFDNLYAEFANNGYAPEKDLFTFGYNWEDSNVDTAKLLKQKIQEVKTVTNWPKVDVVAHSMGGLVARQYIESGDYKGDIDQLITLGTPNNGAPEAYLKWEGNAWFWGAGDLYGKHILDQEIEESDGKYADGFDYIHNRPVASLQELLPVYNYLQDVQNNYGYQVYPTGYPRNIFLENLNKIENITKLNNVEFDKIVGNVGDDEGTIDGFKVVKADMGNLWMDGYPLGFEVIVGDRGIIKSNGDRTVPIESAKSENIPSDYIKEIDSVHSYLPTEAQSDVLELLTNKRPTGEVKNSLIHNILFAQVYSPIDIQIIAPDGIHWIGKNITGLDEDNQIEGAYYTGYDTDNEFATIPDPEDGEYQVVTEGTGDGEYAVRVSKISEDESGTGQAKESTADITGTAVKDRVEESQATVSGDTVTTETQDTTPPTITATVTPEANENGWHNTDVTVHFDATDDSGIKPGSVTPDVIFSAEGEDQSVIGGAEDNAGNKNSFTVGNINIDKTAPVTEATPIGTQGNNEWYTSSVTINFSATDNLSGVDKTSYSLDGGNVQSGNSVTIDDDGLHQIKYHSQDLAGNAETEKSLEIKIDQTAPVVSITSPENKNYKNSGMLLIKFAVRDNLTAEENLKTEIRYDGNIMDNLSVDLSLEKLGEHVVSIVAIDEAGNGSEVAQASFNVDTDIDSISKNVKHYFSLGLIKKRSTEFFLEVKLRNIQELMKLLNTCQSRFMPQWAKNRVIENLKRNINHQINELERQIQYNKNLKRTIDPKIQEIILENLEAVKV